MWWAIGRGLVWAFAGIQSYQFAQPVLRFFGLLDDENESPGGSTWGSLALLLAVIIAVFLFAFFLLRAHGTFDSRRETGE